MSDTSHRHPRTTQERASASAAEEQGVPVRSKRSSGLPHLHDDLSRHYMRSWKKTRRTQYKAQA